MSVNEEESYEYEYDYEKENERQRTFVRQSLGVLEEGTFQLLFFIFHNLSWWQHTSDLSDICGLNRQNFLFYVGSQYVWMKYLSNI